MKKLSCVLIVMLLGSVSCAGKQDNDYLHSQNAPKLIVPPPLTCEYIDDFYDLPSQDEDPHASILPPIEPVVETDP